MLFGTNQLSVLQITTNDALTSVVGTNGFVRLETAPVFHLVLGAEGQEARGSGCGGGSGALFREWWHK